jgi:hypothetical protein
MQMSSVSGSGRISCVNTSALSQRAKVGRFPICARGIGEGCRHFAANLLAHACRSGA